MSALGQKQTCAVQNVMSALPPKADMCSATRHVRFVPITDITPLIRSFLKSCGCNLRHRKLFGARQLNRELDPSPIALYGVGSKSRLSTNREEAT